MKNLIEVNQLTKTFKSDASLTEVLTGFKHRKAKTQALENVSFKIAAGRILGLVGENGAGKTTLQKIIAGLIKPDHGKVLICGRTVETGEPSLRKLIGVTPSDERTFFWRMTGMENIRFFGSLYGMPKKLIQDRAQVLFDIMQMTSKINERFSNYSAGMRKKLAVIRAILHQPNVLLLDEVTNSLDPAAIELVKKLVRNYVTQKPDRCAVWSTHRLEEISQICDTVIALNKGTPTYHGPAAKYKHPITAQLNQTA